jgi:hypothetical protein
MTDPTPLPEPVAVQLAKWDRLAPRKPRTAAPGLFDLDHDGHVVQTLPLFDL